MRHGTNSAGETSCLHKGSGIPMESEEGARRRRSRKQRGRIWKTRPQPTLLYRCAGWSEPPSGPRCRSGRRRSRPRPSTRAPARGPYRGTARSFRRGALCRPSSGRRRNCCPPRSPPRPARRSPHGACRPSGPQRKPSRPRAGRDCSPTPRQSP